LKWGDYIPTYFLATIADHIVLWQSAFKGPALLSGKSKFTLAGSGHLAGVINPPEGGKYPHWQNDNLAETPEEWFTHATEKPGSWWPDWHNWLHTNAGNKVTSPKPGKHKSFPAIEDAPGRYVKKRL